MKTSLRLNALYPLRLCIGLLLALAAPGSACHAGEYFVEAESFKTTPGWEVLSDTSTRTASGLAVLTGARGPAGGEATTTLSIKDAGQYRIWVRYASHPKWRGPFRVTASAGGRDLGSGVFDEEFEGKSARDNQTWKAFDAVLPEGEVTLKLSKQGSAGASGPARHVDCLLLTMDAKLVPNHLHYGAQTYLRVTFGEGYAKPVYLHIFSDHYHAPWYQHYSLGRSGAVAAVSVKKQDLLGSGEQTGWCNVSPLIYQDSGAMLHLTARESYTEYAPRLRARLEIATAPDDASIVRTLEIDNQPGGLALYLPPNLLTAENRAVCKTDAEVAAETGRLADAFAWPQHGQKPELFPFFVNSSVERTAPGVDARVAARERKTLDYFGYTNDDHRRMHGGVWDMLQNSYCQPDLAKMTEHARAAAAKFKEEGRSLKEITYCQLTDEPTGKPLAQMAEDPPASERFRAWLKAAGQTPASLLVRDWDAVKIVTEAQRDQFPALYYFSQRFRTRALGDFMATQRQVLEEAYGGTIPILANFSDGAIYSANFYGQGVDYFELLSSPQQNAIWGEDWSNGASTYQCASFNVDLMRAAARYHGQTIGHYLIAYANRKPWDVKLKATSELARGVKMMSSFYYGPAWATHEGGPYYRSTVWQAKPETWSAYAAIPREVGAVEDLLLTAMPAPAQVALLYSSSSDAWTINDNLAYGFDRMHTWLALAHAQVPVDIVSEQQAANGGLTGKTVCYLSGPNLSRAAAEKLRFWVKQGGTLWMTAGAASRDEYNQPLHVLDNVLPAARDETANLQIQTGSGRTLRGLSAKDEVTWKQGSAAVLAVKQSLIPWEDANVLATFKDQSPALVSRAAGHGRIYCAGFLPALAYIKEALDARFALEEKAAADPNSISPVETALLARSANPWAYPTALRELLLTPVREAGVVPPIHCDTPLVDAVYMPHEAGLLIPLANYTNERINALALQIQVPKPIARVISALRGPLSFHQTSPSQIELSLPLENNDFVKLSFK